MTKIVSLLQWSKKYSVVYSLAQKQAVKGLLPATKVGGRWKIDEDVAPIPLDTVVCRICDKSLPQITHTHLEKHCLTREEYLVRYPDALLAPPSIGKRISDALSGIPKSPEHCAAVSAGRKGTIPKNHPRYVVGKYTASDITKQRMSVAHTGQKHTDETKKKIGDAHRGKIIPPHLVEAQKERLRLFYQENPAPFKGRTHTAENKALFSEQRKQWWNSLSETEREAISEQRSNSLRGKKRTEEQKQRYREATIKARAENPERFRISKGEQMIADWFESKGILYRRQPFLTFEGVSHPYDFLLPEHNMLLEFDGSHHWYVSWFSISKSMSPEEQERVNEEAIRKQQEEDAHWNFVAGHFGYSIVRIYGRNVPGDSWHGTIEEQLALQGIDFDLD